MLSELFLSTDGKSPEEIESVQKKAEDLRDRVMKGDDFKLENRRSAVPEGSAHRERRRKTWARSRKPNWRRSWRRSCLRDGKGPDHRRRDSDQDRVRSVEEVENPLPGRFAAHGQSGLRKS